jgi:hypothetical protein
MPDWTEDEEQTGEHRDSMPDKGVSYVFKVVHFRDIEDGRGGGQWWKRDCYFSTRSEALAYKEEMTGLYASYDSIVLVEIRVNHDGKQVAEEYRRSILKGLSDVQRSALK